MVILYNSLSPPSIQAPIESAEQEDSIKDSIDHPNQEALEQTLS